MLMATYGSTAYFQGNATSGTNLISIIWKDIQKNLLKYIEKIL